MLAAALLVASYLLGAIPTSYLVCRLLKGVDLRTIGSRNLGATNLYRVMGLKVAVPVGLFDAAKGAVPVLLFAPRVSDSSFVALGFGAVAIVGHVFSVFVGFKGGKGVATAAGVMLGLLPAALGVAFLVWVVTVRLTGFVSLGSILGALTLPPAAWLLEPERRALVPFTLLVAAAIVWLHRANIGRLRAGTENRVGRRAAQAGPS